MDRKFPATKLPVHMNSLITLVIPVRLSENNLYDEVVRIQRILDTVPSEGFESLIVDYGSCEERRQELTDIGHRNSVTVIRVDSGDQVFSVGKARDIGTQHARTPLVLYHDIDFLMSRENYRRILLEARVRNLPENNHAFFVLPGAYLTESFSEEYVALSESGDGELADYFLHDAIMRLDHSVFSGMTYAISALVAHRLHLLAVGGHDPQFVGHGAEDFELFHRLASYFRKGPRTKDYYANTIGSNSIQTYAGFRAFFALYGIDVFQRGLILAHLYHPRRPDPEYAETTNNSRVGDVMRAYDTGSSYLPPLPDLTIREKTLFLAAENSAPWQALRQVIPLLGECTFRKEEEFGSPSGFRDFLSSENFTQIIFIFEKRDQDQIALYDSAKAEGCQTIVFGKGGFEDSWFFDREGIPQEGHADDRPEKDTDRFHSFGKLRDHEPHETGAKGPAGRIDFTIIRGILPESLASDFTRKPFSLHAPLFYSYGGVHVLANLQSHPEPPAGPSPQSLVHAGFQAYHAGNFRESADLLTQGISSSAPDPSLLRALAEAHISLGNNEAALDSLQKAHQLIPGNKNLKRRLRDLKSPKWLRTIIKSKPFCVPQG